MDIAIVGGGAAGLATAIFAARRLPGARVVVFDSARRLGAKILVSGGGRCNVTNRVVRASDFWGGDRRVVASVLRAFSAADAAAFFEELGVRLHEEEDGKLFPDSGSASDVLGALLDAAARAGVELALGQSRRVDPAGRRGRLHRARRRLVRDARGKWSWRPAASRCRRAAATAAAWPSPRRSATASFRRRLRWCRSCWTGRSTNALSGVVARGGACRSAATAARTVTLRGPLLWTHFGVSGPVVARRVAPLAPREDRGA